jgi:ABC-type branched-subunit amino acid transport system substrate-binding protein
MITKTYSYAFFAAKLLCAALFFPVLLAAQLTPQQLAGKQIYTEGKSSSGTPVEAVLGGGSTTVPASLMPCASCHGPEGQGRPEGGVVPSNITWDVLGKELTSDDALERKRPAYSVDSLRHVLTSGTDPAGNHLGITMPQFKMSGSDLDNLIAYLHVLGKESDPGLSAGSIRIGVVVPAGGPLTPLARNLTDLLQAWFTEANKQGGIYDRNLELQLLQPENSQSAQDLLRRNNIFAGITILDPLADHDPGRALETGGIPAITTFASGADGELSKRSHVFYLLSGLTQQAQVLARFAHINITDPKTATALVYPADMQELADSVLDESRKASLKVLPWKYEKFEAAQMAASLARQNVQSVLFLGTSKELERMLESGTALKWFPRIFQPGSLAGTEVFDLPAGFSDRIFISYPFIPSDFDRGAMREYEFLMHKYKVPPVNPTLGLSVIASAKVLVEGLREAGRQLSRAKLVETLSNLYGFNTGFTPLVSFSSTRRVGVLGAYVVKLDLKNKTFVQADAWMEP